jgi:hypothetical protein
MRTIQKRSFLITYFCQFVKAFQVTFRTVNVSLDSESPVPIHDEGHMFGYWSSLQDALTQSLKPGTLVLLLWEPRHADLSHKMGLHLLNSIIH